jgi:hypothetical protein
VPLQAHSYKCHTKQLLSSWKRCSTDCCRRRRRFRLPSTWKTMRSAGSCRRQCWHRKCRLRRWLALRIAHKQCFGFGQSADVQRLWQVLLQARTTCHVMPWTEGLSIQHYSCIQASPSGDKANLTNYQGFWVYFYTLASGKSSHIRRLCTVHNHVRCAGAPWWQHPGS